MNRIITERSRFDKSNSSIASVSLYINRIFFYNYGDEFGLDKIDTVLSEANNQCFELLMPEDNNKYGYVCDRNGSYIKDNDYDFHCNFSDNVNIVIAVRATDQLHFEMRKFRTP